MILVRLLVLAALVWPRLATADAHLQVKTHIDGYYSNGVPRPAEDYVTDYWIGGKRMAINTPNTSVVIDAGKGRMLIINLVSKSYVEAALPFAWQGLVGEQLLGRVQGFPQQGTVERDGRKQKIGSRRCRAYKVAAWWDFNGRRYNESEETHWATRGLKLKKPKAVRAMMADYLRLVNLAPSFIKALGGIDGFVVKREITHHRHGFQYTEIRELVSAEQIAPPPGTYEAPSGFDKREQLTAPDLSHR